MSIAKFWGWICIINGLVLGLAGSAFASSHTPMTFRTFEPCRGSASFCGTRILASGVIESDSHQKLSAFIASAPKYAIPPRPTIVFDSPGGSLAGGVALGRFIRNRGYDTALEENVEEEFLTGGLNGSTSLRYVATDTMCASACAIAFLGGRSRSITPNAHFGVHQFYSTNGNLGDSVTQVKMTELALYIEEMGVDRRLLDFATSAGPNSMRWLGDREVRELRIDNTRPLPAEWRINADTNGVPSLSVRQWIAPDRELILSMQNGSRAVIVTVLVIITKDAQGQDSRSRFPVGEALRVKFTNERKLVAKAEPVSSWREVRSNHKGAVVYGGIVTITHDDLRRMSSAANLELDDDFPGALSDLSIASKLSAEGLRNGANLLLRTH